MLSKILAAMAEHNVRVLSGFHEAPAAAEKAHWSFFADFANSNLEPDAFAIKLRAIPNVLDVRVKLGSDGFIVDSMHYPVLVGEDRALVVRAEMLTALIGRVHSLFGKGSASAAVVLHQIGEASGASSFNYMSNKRGEDFIKKHLDQTLRLYSAQGWGIFSVNSADSDQKRWTIQVRECFECLNLKNSSKTPVCHFVRGIISGLFSQLFSQKMDCVETKCPAKGDDSCLFEVKLFKS